MYKPPQIDTNQHLLKVKDVAYRLNISKSLTYRLIQSGHLPAVRISKAVRIRQVDLDHFIETHVSNQP